MAGDPSLFLFFVCLHHDVRGCCGGVVACASRWSCTRLAVLSGNVRPGLSLDFDVALSYTTVYLSTSTSQNSLWSRARPFHALIVLQMAFTCSHLVSLRSLLGHNAIDRQIVLSTLELPGLAHHVEN